MKTPKNEKNAQNRPQISKIEKKGFLEKNAPEVPGSSGGRAPKFRGVPGRSDFKHSFGKGSSGSSGGVAKVGLQERQKPSLHPKRLRRAKFSQIPQNRQICGISRIFALQCLGAAKASGPEIRALPSVSLVFFPLCVLEVMSRVSSRL